MSDLEKRLGYSFSDPELLVCALTHRSRANDEGDPDLANERLEFLGDAVLDLLVAQLLMAVHPDASEGVLSRARASLVNTRALAERSRRLGLDQAVRLGRSEETSQGRSKPSILANVFEAILGAIYLDGGLAAVGALVEREFRELLELRELPLVDPKTRLQELMHTRNEAGPRYETTAARGPDHAKEFEVEVRIEDQLLGVGKGSSKREAEQQAARAALVALKA